MPPPPDNRGDGIFEATASAGGSAPANPPEDPADVGLENKRVAAFVIMRSGGASSVAGCAAAGAGSTLGAEPKGFMRLIQPGPEDNLTAGRLLAN